MIVDSAEAIAAAYATGRGGFRVRARWAIEEGRAGHLDRGGHRDPLSRCPRRKLIEQIAALIADKKLPILADVRDESDEEIRIVIEPRSRTVDPQMLMDSLFRLTDLEVRVPLNLNVLDANRTPRVMGLQARCSADGSRFQIEVLVRRSQAPARRRSTTGSSCSTAI